MPQEDGTAEVKVGYSEISWSDIQSLQTDVATQVAMVEQQRKKIEDLRAFVFDASYGSDVELVTKLDMALSDFKKTEAVAETLRKFVENMARKYEELADTIEKA